MDLEMNLRERDDERESSPRSYSRSPSHKAKNARFWTLNTILNHEACQFFVPMLADLSDHFRFAPAHIHCFFHPNPPTNIRFILFAFEVVFLAVGEFGYWTWRPEDPIWKMPKSGCTCDCWDRQVKVGYIPFITPGSQYKSIYINTDRITGIIIAWTIFYAASAFIYIQTALKSYLKGRLRYGLFAISVLQVYPNVYNFNATFNYFNDRWFSLFGHQVYFDISEWIVMAIIVFHLSKKRPISRLATLVIFAIVAVHFAQIVVDEGILATLLLQNKRPMRNIVLGMGDLCSTLYFLRRIVRKQYHKDQTALALVAGLILFQLLLINWWIPSPQ